MQLLADGSASCHVGHVALTLKVNMPTVTAARLLDLYLVVDSRSAILLARKQQILPVL